MISFYSLKLFIMSYTIILHLVPWLIMYIRRLLFPFDTSALKLLFNHLGRQLPLLRVFVILPIILLVNLIKQFLFPFLLLPLPLHSFYWWPQYARRRLSLYIHKYIKQQTILVSKIVFKVDDLFCCIILLLMSSKKSSNLNFISSLSN